MLFQTCMNSVFPWNTMIKEKLRSLFDGEENSLFFLVIFFNESVWSVSLTSLIYYFMSPSDLILNINSLTLIW